MAVNNLNPAVVPPTASEIATAVAAPSAATIATSVAAAVPTRAQIQTDITNLGNAYNGPSAATIASTVAAPSAATIASAVAAAVPTTAGITSIVQANAGSPFGGTWTTIYDNRALTGVSSVTVSGLGSYRYIKVFYNLYLVAGSSGGFAFMRLNGDNTFGNYNSNFLKRQNSTATVDSITFYGSDRIRFNYVAPDFDGQCTGTIEILNSNQTGSFKVIEGKHGRSRQDNTQGTQLGLNAAWYSNSAVTSLTISSDNPANYQSSHLIILGAN